MIGCDIFLCCIWIYFCYSERSRRWVSHYCAGSIFFQSIIINSKNWPGVASSRNLNSKTSIAEKRVNSFTNYPLNYTKRLIRKREKQYSLQYSVCSSLLQFYTALGTSESQQWLSDSGQRFDKYSNTTLQEPEMLIAPTIDSSGFQDLSQANPNQYAHFITTMTRTLEELEFSSYLQSTIILKHATEKLWYNNHVHKMELFSCPTGPWTSISQWLQQVDNNAGRSTWKILLYDNNTGSNNAV